MLSFPETVALCTQCRLSPHLIFAKFIYVRTQENVHTSVHFLNVIRHLQLPPTIKTMYEFTQVNVAATGFLLLSNGLCERIIHIFYILSNENQILNNFRSGEKPFACEEPGCGKRFTEYSSFYKHQVV